MLHHVRQNLQERGRGEGKGGRGRETPTCPLSYVDPQKWKS